MTQDKPPAKQPSATQASVHRSIFLNQKGPKGSDSDESFLRLINMLLSVGSESIIQNMSETVWPTASSWRASAVPHHQEQNNHSVQWIYPLAAVT
jgi:hypothetical protein